MMKFSDLIIVSDMDGTFLGEKSSVLQNNLDAISYFQKNGGIFTLATGRNFQVIKYIFPQYKEYVLGPAILCNGAYLYNYQKNEMIDETELDKEEFIPILSQLMKEFPRVGAQINTSFGFLCPQTTPFMENWMKPYLKIVKREDIDSYLDIPWHKCVFVGEEDDIKKLSEAVTRISLKNIKCTTSKETLFEFLPISSGKESKIRRLKELYPDRKAICVGDFANDLDMLSVADVAACPENALPEIKRISTIHLCHHRDGCIADLIYKLDSSIKE